MLVGLTDSLRNNPLSSNCTRWQA